MEDLLRQLNNRGYTFDKNRNKYMARIYFNDKSYFLGRYETKHEARIVYLYALLYKTYLSLDGGLFVPFAKGTFPLT